MHEIDLIPQSYRDSRARAVWLKLSVGTLAFLMVGTATARIWLSYAVEGVETNVARLQAEQTITTRQRDELAARTQERTSYQEQLHLLKGLRSGTAATNLFRIIDETLVHDELWFTDWTFRRAGVTNAEGQSVETGYFIVVSDEAQQNETWQVETHMTIAGQARDHAALSEFVTRLLNRHEIENVRIRRTELQRYSTHSIVGFELAVVINSQVLE